MLDRPAVSQQAGIESSLRRFLHQAVGPLDEAPDGLAFLSGSLLADRLEHLFEFLDFPFRFLEVILRRAGIGSTERAGVTNGCARVLQAGALATIGRPGRERRRKIIDRGLPRLIRAAPCFEHRIGLCCKYRSWLSNFVSNANCVFGDLLLSKSI